MKWLNLIFKKETAAPALAVTFTSAVAVALVLARMAWTGELRYGFLIWNLSLAWLPLLFALLACDECRSGAGRRWRLFGLAGAWLLFFPNAPYIFTDLIHLTRPIINLHFWSDLTLILLCALTGLVLGFMSLYLMQSLVARRFGRVAGWLFVAAAAGLSSVGVYLGRFLRFNSWDVLHPARMYRRIDAWVDGPRLPHGSIAFLMLFATFLFLSYVMLYALTRVAPALQADRELDLAE